MDRDICDSDLVDISNLIFQSFRTVTSY